MSTSLKALIIAAFSIVLLFLIGERFGLRSNTREPLEYAMELDTAAVSTIRFEDLTHPRNGLLLHRSNANVGWTRSSLRTYGTPPGEQAGELLMRFHALKVKRDMGMIRLLGERYELTGNTLCRITFTTYDGDRRTLNLGSSTFAPGKTGAWTYVNIPGEREVYAVEGLLTDGLRTASE